MAVPNRGEVWLVDLGYAAKTRPCLVLSVPTDDENARVLVTLIPHTTSVRGSEFEIQIPTRFLKPGAFDTQNLISVSCSKLLRNLGSLTKVQMTAVEHVVRRWLGL